jgi:hypothetical protein
MNNKYFATLLCISALTFAPACTKKHDKAQSRENINTMIESETEVFEMEEEMSDQKIVKF